MDQIEERAPPKPQTSRWKEITARNTAQYKARRAPLHKRAFKGLQPDPRRTSGVDARYSRTAAHGGRRAHGGARRNLAPRLLGGACGGRRRRSTRAPASRTTRTT